MRLCSDQQVLTIKRLRGDGDRARIEDPPMSREVCIRVLAVFSHALTLVLESVPRRWKINPSEWTAMSVAIDELKGSVESCRVAF